MHQIVTVEGARNCGKTFLISQLDNSFKRYKFPFAKYFNEVYRPQFANLHDSKEANNSDAELFHFTMGYDVSIFEMVKQGILTESVVVDRGVLSDLVFGVQSGRVRQSDAIVTWKWFCDTYGDAFTIVYIDGIMSEDGRDKDMWDLYGIGETRALYEMFFALGGKQPIVVSNNFDGASVERFSVAVGSL
jgi:hypothetical protein